MQSPKANYVCTIWRSVGKHKMTQCRAHGKFRNVITGFRFKNTTIYQCDQYGSALSTTLESRENVALPQHYRGWVGIGFEE